MVVETVVKPRLQHDPELALDVLQAIAPLSSVAFDTESDTFLAVKYAVIVMQIHDMALAATMSLTLADPGNEAWLAVRDSRLSVLDRFSRLTDSRLNLASYFYLWDELDPQIESLRFQYEKPWDPRLLKSIRDEIWRVLFDTNKDEGGGLRRAVTLLESSIPALSAPSGLKRRSGGTWGIKFAEWWLGIEKRDYAENTLLFIKLSEMLGPWSDRQQQVRLLTLIGAARDLYKDRYDPLALQAEAKIGAKLGGGRR